MQPIVAQAWTTCLQDLWNRIEQHSFESAEALDFTRRLARDRGWTLDFARAAIGEYRRFCFLAVVCPDPVTPSEEVDEVWHQHLIYSRDYWNVWCDKVLCRKLHHEPTAGGPAEHRRFHEQYASTLARYESFFGPPPELYWPASHQRFGSRPRYRVFDAKRRMLLPRPVTLCHWFSRLEKAR